MPCGSGNLIVNGTMTWFCCGSAWGPCGRAGTGACGTCHSGHLKCAWPNASAACFDITRPDQCGKRMPRKTCGSVLHVKNRCSNQCVRVTVADCGPDTNRFCRESNCCGNTCGRARVIDLTPAAFSRIANLSAGVRPCRVNR